MGPFLIINAGYYQHIAALQLQGAGDVFKKAGIAFEVLDVPGALEIPAAIAAAANAGGYQGFVALGCVIRGETYHFEVVSNESAHGIMQLANEGLAIGNGILTVENEAQALKRADPKLLDKGGAAARTAIRMAEIFQRFGAEA